MLAEIACFVNRSVSRYYSNTLQIQGTDTGPEPALEKTSRTGHPEIPNQRLDWIRTKAPFAYPVFFGWRTKNLGKEGAFDAGYWM
jgi:hypothetical protein